MSAATLDQRRAEAQQNVRALRDGCSGLMMTRLI